MDFIVGDLTNGTLDIIYKETRKKHNQKKISYIIDKLVIAREMLRYLEYEKMNEQKDNEDV